MGVWLPPVDYAPRRRRVASPMGAASQSRAAGKQQHQPPRAEEQPPEEEHEGVEPEVEPPQADE